jgi:hypothetical protein
MRNVGSHKIYTAPHPEDGILHTDRRENLKSYIVSSLIFTLLIILGEKYIL